jgi:hypothetical protein
MDCQFTVALRFVAVAGLAFLGCASNADTDTTDDEIISGVRETESAGVLVQWLEDGTPAHCTGVLVSPRVVVTSGHCVNVPASPWQFTGEVPNARPKRVAFASTETVLFGKVADDSAAHDVALLILTAPVATGLSKFPAIQATEPTAAELYFSVGRVRAGEPTSSLLRSPKFNLVKTQEADIAPFVWEGVGRNFMEGGDSGGPVINTKNGSVVALNRSHVERGGTFHSVYQRLLPARAAILEFIKQADRVNVASAPKRCVSTGVALAEKSKATFAGLTCECETAGQRLFCKL